MYNDIKTTNAIKAGIKDYKRVFDDSPLTVAIPEIDTLVEYIKTRVKVRETINTEFKSLLKIINQDMKDCEKNFKNIQRNQRLGIFEESPDYEEGFLDALNHIKRQVIKLNPELKEVIK